MIDYQQTIDAATAAIAGTSGASQTCGQSLLAALQTAATQYVQTVLPIFPSGDLGRRDDGAATLTLVRADGTCLFAFVGGQGARPVPYPLSYSAHPMPTGGILFSQVIANLNAAITNVQKWLAAPTVELLTRQLVAGVLIEVGMLIGYCVSARLVVVNPGNVQAQIAVQDAGVIKAVAALVGLGAQSVNDALTPIGGSIPKAWTGAFNNPAPVVPGEDSAVAALILDGWVKE